MSDMAERELAQEPARERADWMEKAGEYLERLHEAELERDAANRRYRELAAAREDTERPWDHSRPCDCGHRYGQHSQEYGITCDAENCGCRQLHQRPDPPR